MRLQIMNATTMALASTKIYDNEDEAAADCDKFMKDTDQLHFVFAPIYSPMFGWVQENRDLWHEVALQRNLG